MMLSSTGLRWRKVDLHVHTPASADYTGPSISPADFVAVAQGKGLDAIAITDHNTGAWIDRLKEAAKDSGLTVFPGVEISATGGEFGIHVVALFDIRENGKTVESLLAKLGIEPRDHGKTEAITAQSPEQVLETIAEMGGLAVLAHADSSKGVLSDMKGTARTRVIRCASLAAVELCNYSKSARFLDGSDPTYKRHVACYRASDNPNPSGSHGHSADGIGSRFSWFKMDGMSLRALQQCFADPVVRIIPDSLAADNPSRSYPSVCARTSVAHSLSRLLDH